MSENNNNKNTEIIIQKFYNAINSFHKVQIFTKSIFFFGGVQCYLNRISVILWQPVILSQLSLFLGVMTSINALLARNRTLFYLKQRQTEFLPLRIYPHPNFQAAKPNGITFGLLVQHSSILTIWVIQKFKFL